MKGGATAIKFYDTNAVLKLQQKIFEEQFVISSVTLYELENIKSSRNKDDEIKYNARKVIHLLNDNECKYFVIPYTSDIEKIMHEYHVTDSPDNEIIACAKHYSGLRDIVFVTDDLCCKVIARDVFKLNVWSVGDEEEEYKGFKEVVISDEEMAYFYEHQYENIYGLLTNEYLIIKNLQNEIVDTYRWDGEKHCPIYKKPIKSAYFDKLKPKDIYQSCAIDSMMNCTITALSGKAGSGKSLITLIAAMSLIETGKYDRIVVMFNPVKSRGTSDLGFYSGDFVSKAMQNSIGQILTTKFGDRYAVDILMQQEKLKLVSMADARGMEIRDNEILWITEASNTSVDLIKLCLTRVSSGAKVFIEGDYLAQVDSKLFEGSNNGLKRVIDVFKGHEEFGYMELQNVWRSKIAELCELL